VQAVGIKFELQGVGIQFFPTEERLAGFLFGDGKLVDGEAAGEIQFCAPVSPREGELAAGGDHARLQVQFGEPVDIGLEGFQREAGEFEIDPARCLARNDAARDVEVAALLDAETRLNRYGPVHVEAEVLRPDEALRDVEFHRFGGRQVGDADFDPVQAQARQFHIHTRLLIRSGRLGRRRFGRRGLGRTRRLLQDLRPVEDLVLVQNHPGVQAFQFHGLDDQPVVRKIQFRIDEAGPLQHCRFLGSRQHPYRPQRGVHRADLDSRHRARLARKRGGHPESFGLDGKRLREAPVGKMRRPVGESNFAHVDLPRLRRRTLFRCRLRIGRRARLPANRGEQGLPIERPLGVARRGQLAARQAHVCHADAPLRQVQARPADPRLGQLQNGRASSARGQREAQNAEAGTVDRNGGLCCARLVGRHGKAVAQVRGQRAGRDFKIARDLVGPLQIGEPDSGKGDFAFGRKRVQAEIALQGDRAALLRKLGLDPVIAAVVEQRGQAVEFDPERLQCGFERWTLAGRVGEFDIAVGDLDVIDQRPRHAA